MCTCRLSFPFRLVIMFPPCEDQYDIAEEPLSENISKDIQHSSKRLIQSWALAVENYQEGVHMTQFL